MPAVTSSKLQALRDALSQAKNAYWAEQVEIQRQAATAWVARAEGRHAEAVGAMRSAADLEDASEKHIAMENRLVPMRELLGELLLEVNEPAAALAEFEASLQRVPNRFRSFSGAARAAELAGDREKAKVFYAKLVALADQGRHRPPRACATPGPSSPSRSRTLAGLGRSVHAGRDNGDRGLGRPGRPAT